MLSSSKNVVNPDKISIKTKEETFWVFFKCILSTKSIIQQIQHTKYFNGQIFFL